MARPSHPNRLRPFFRFLAAVNHIVLVLLILSAIIASVTLTGCARAAGHPGPKVGTPTMPEPTILRPAPVRVGHHPRRTADDTMPLPTPFTYGEEITPPKGCLELRQRTHNPGAC